MRQQIIRTLDEATEEIFVAFYWFTNQQLFGLFCDKL
jgi:hypothetical protein